MVTHVVFSLPLEKDTLTCERATAAATRTKKANLIRIINRKLFFRNFRVLSWILCKNHLYFIFPLTLIIEIETPERDGLTEVIKFLY